MEYTVLPREEVTPAAKPYIKGTTDKDPLSYKVGEPITFNLTYMNGNDTVACPKIAYTVSKDDGKYESGQVACVNGTASVTTTLSCEGFVRLTAKAVAANNSEISSVTEFIGGAAANAQDIRQTVEEPADFDDFWYAEMDKLLEIDPDILSMKVISDASTYTIYDVKIKAVDDSAVYNDGKLHNYVSGTLTVPKGTNKVAIEVRFRGYGVEKSEITESAGCITFNVMAHSIEAWESSSYYSALNSGALSSYGFKNNDSRDNVYFKNMLLRDLQAIHWVKEYFSSAEGGNRWNGKSFIVYGPSQGGFQAVATTAYAYYVGVTVNTLNVTVPWLCDVGRTTSKRMNSVFLPSYTKALDYFDTINFASRIRNGKISITVALADQTSRPTGVIAMYNALGVANKNITYIQNSDHSFYGTPNTTSTIKVGDFE